MYKKGKKSEQAEATAFDNKEQKALTIGVVSRRMIPLSFVPEYNNLERKSNETHSTRNHEAFEAINKRQVADNSLYSDDINPDDYFFDENDGMYRPFDDGE